MSLSELVLIFGVVLLVFGPKKLPMAAKHLAMMVNFIEKQKHAYMQSLDAFMKQETLKENERKAKAVEDQEKALSE